MEQVMKFNVSPKVYTILGTYARAFVAAVVASYMTGNTSVKALFASGTAAVIPVILRWANPGDQFPHPQPSMKKAAAVVEGTQDPLA
jgi:cystathionine beta-lyase/cystathionine gamma-synthase